MDNRDDDDSRDEHDCILDVADELNETTLDESIHFDQLLEEINAFINAIDSELINDSDSVNSDDNYTDEENIIDGEISQMDELDKIDEMINEKYYELVQEIDSNYNILNEWNYTSFNLFMKDNQDDQSIDTIKEIISASEEFLSTDFVTIRNTIDELFIEFDVVYQNSLLEVKKTNDRWTEFILTSRYDDILYKKEVLHIEFERFIWFIDAFKDHLERYKIRKWSYLWAKSNCSFN